MIKVLVYLVVGFFSTISVAYLYYKLTDSSKCISLKAKLFFLVGVLAITYINYYNVEGLNVGFFFIYFPFLFMMLNNIRFKKLVFYLIAVWAVGIIFDLVLMIVFSVIAYFFNVNLYGDYHTAFSIILSILVSLVLLILSKSHKIKDNIRKLYMKVDSIKYIDLVLFIFALFVLLITVIMLIYIRNLNINILLIFVVMLMFITITTLIKYKINEEENSRYLKTLRENNEFYIKMEDENRIFKHNLIAKLLSIKSVSNKKAMALIEDLILQFNKSVDFSDGMKVIPYGLNGIIYQKLYPHLKKLNVKIHNDISYDIFSVLKPRRYNVLVEKMVVTLDNAIESSLKSKEKSIVINISDDDDNIYIEISNTFKGDINVDMLGKKDYSTKGKSHGLGLFSILRNNEASVSVKIINNVFVSKITTKKRLNN